MSSPSTVPQTCGCSHNARAATFQRIVDRLTAEIPELREEAEHDRRKLERIVARPATLPGRFQKNGKTVIRGVPRTSPLYEPIRQGLIQLLEAEIATVPTRIARKEELIVRYQGTIVEIQNNHRAHHERKQARKEFSLQRRQWAQQQLLH